MLEDEHEDYTSAPPPLPDGCAWVCCVCRSTDQSPCVDDNTTECDVCGLIACGDYAVKGFPDCGHC